MATYGRRLSYRVSPAFSRKASSGAALVIVGDKPRRNAMLDVVRLRWVMALVAACSIGCEGTDAPEPDREGLRQPSGLALSPDGRWLFVTGGNWDLVQSHGTLMTVDLAGVHTALVVPDDPRCPPASDELGVRECYPAAFIDGDRTILMGSALGNIAVDLPGGAAGALRLLAVQRVPAAVRWMDAFVEADGVRIDCGQDPDGVCDDAHELVASIDDPDIRLPRDPSRVVLDREGFRFAYVPHLLDSAISVINLDGERGPELTAVQGDFYQPDPFDDGVDIAGGFSVAQRACDPQNPSDASRDCSRPLLFTTHRYWPGIRQFTIAPGLEVVLGGPTDAVTALNPEVVESRPFMGDLEFEDPEHADSLLIVQTTPAGLARVDTSLDEDADPRVELEQTAATCSNPNLLEIYRPEGEEPLALVTCFGDGALTVVALGSFTVVRTIPLGAGANEIVVDAARRQAYVANTREGTISIVSLDRRDPRFLTEWARIGRADRGE